MFSSMLINLWREKMLYKDIVIKVRKEEKTELLDKFFLKFTYCSLKIQNEETRLCDVGAIFKEERLSGFKSDKKTIRAIENHKKLCNNLIQISKENNGKLSINLIKQFHYILMKDCFPEELLLKGERPGELRKDENVIELEENLKLLLENINSIELNEDNAIDGISYFNCKFENLQPFSYGNGILVRMLMNYILIANNLPPILFYYDDKEAYYSSLETFNDREEIDCMKKFLDEQAYKTWVKNYNVKLKGLKDFLD